MPFIPYNTNIPAANNNPSVDQPDMQENTNSTESWVAVDHYGFNDNNGGLHKQTRIVDQVAIPAGLAAGMSTLYSKLATSEGVSQESDLFFSPGTSGNQYQLTRAITGKFALFGQNTNNYNGIGVDYDGGWTYLPGGILLQYGRLKDPDDGDIILFPVQYTNAPFSIQLTSVQNTSNNFRCAIQDGSITTSQFSVYSSSSSNHKYIYWLAIGV